VKILDRPLDATEVTTIARAWPPILFKREHLFVESGRP
jgi:hypothetical protein